MTPSALATSPAAASRFAGLVWDAATRRWGAVALSGGGEEGGDAAAAAAGAAAWEAASGFSSGGEGLLG